MSITPLIISPYYDYFKMKLGDQDKNVTDCYFCLTKVKGFNKKTAKNIKYPNLPSAGLLLKLGVNFVVKDE